jgi:HSP20 family molecular chaperone IbpA
MAFFFPRTVYHAQAPAPSFNPFLRILIDDLDKSFARGSCHARRSTSFRPQWQPRFDVQEIDDAYVLQGELPGLNKDQVSVEFPEPSTLVIRGNVEGDKASSSEPAPAAAAAEEKTANDDDAASEHTVGSSSSKTSTYQATVEDDTDDFEVVGDAEKKSLLPEEQQPAPQKEENAKGKQPAAAPEENKYWVRERRAGQFARSFQFNSPIDHEAATASLQDGLLCIIVPKAKKPEPRRINID